MISIVFTSDLEKSDFICDAKEKGISCIKVIDARSAVYVATGICATNREQVLVCMSAGNDSRSAFSGMTEAYYNNYPIALVTFGNGLDYSTGLKDVITAHFRVEKGEEIYPLLRYNRGPMHIEVSTDVQAKEKLDCIKVQHLLATAMTEQDYLYLSQGIEIQSKVFRCKTVVGGMPNCYDGALANVLGASLAKCRKRYIGVLSEEEVIHDINSLGNVNVNDSLAFIVITKRGNCTIAEYAKMQGFHVSSIYEDLLSGDDIERLVKSNQKAMLIVMKESS